MKNVNKFLLLLAIFAFMGSTANVMAQPKNISSILGEYVGEVTVSGGILIPTQSFEDVKMELEELNPYAITVAEIEVGGGVTLPEYKLDKVEIAEVGNTYKLTRSGSLDIVIGEIVIPGMGTFKNVPVSITLENGEVKDDVLTLKLKAVATVTVIFPIPITIDVEFKGNLIILDCDPVTNPEVKIENCETATLTWDPVVGAEGYKIERDGVDPVIVTAPPHIEEKFDFEHEKSYTWKIKTICNKNEASEVTVSTTADCGVCNPVANAKAQIENCEKATITWDVMEGAEEYEIIRDGNLLGTTATNIFPDSDDFEHGKPYTWTIITICKKTKSTEVTVSAIADCEVCSPVTYMEANIENCKKATITWNTVAGAKEYKIEREGVEPVKVTAPPHIEEDFEFEHEQPYTWTITTICEDDTESTELSVTVTANCTSISELANNISIYPNPTKNEFNISGLKFKVTSVEIFDVLGRNVSRLTSHISHPISIDISGLPVGMYFIRIHTENGETVTKKIIKN